MSRTKCSSNEFKNEKGKKVATITNESGVITLVKFNTRVLDEDNLPYGRTVSTEWNQIEGPNYCFDGKSRCHLSYGGPDTFYFAARSNVDTEDRVYRMRLTADDSMAFASDDVYVRVIDTNNPPEVSAGEDREIKLKPDGLTIELAGTVRDDYKTAHWHELNYGWSVVEGPEGGIELSEENALLMNPAVRITQEGEYVLKLSAFDGEYESEDTIKITAIMPENQPPEVKIGPDRMVKLKGGGETVSIPLRARATDDNYPNDSLEYEWSVKFEGTGERTIGPEGDSEEIQQCYSLSSSTDPKSSITFICDGTYTITLTVFDGIEKASDQMIVTVIPGDEGDETKPIAEIELDDEEQNAIVRLTNIFDFDSLKYTLTYSCKTKDCLDGKKDVSSTDSIKITDNVFEKKILLGTCSTSDCTYDEHVDDFELEVTFYDEEGNQMDSLKYKLKKQPFKVILPESFEAVVEEEVTIIAGFENLTPKQKREMLLNWTIIKTDSSVPEKLNKPMVTEEMKYTFSSAGSYYVIFNVAFRSKLDENPYTHIIELKVLDEEGLPSEPTPTDSPTNGDGASENVERDQTPLPDISQEPTNTQDSEEKEEQSPLIMGATTIKFTVNKVIANIIVGRLLAMSYTNQH